MGTTDIRGDTEYNRYRYPVYFTIKLSPINTRKVGKCSLFFFCFLILLYAIEKTNIFKFLSNVIFLSHIKKREKKTKYRFILIVVLYYRIVSFRVVRFFFCIFSKRKKYLSNQGERIRRGEKMIERDTINARADRGG